MEPISPKSRIVVKIRDTTTVIAAELAAEPAAARRWSGLKPLRLLQFGGRHAACVLSRAAERGVHVATGAPLGFGTWALAVQLTGKAVRRTLEG